MVQDCAVLIRARSKGKIVPSGRNRQGHLKVVTYKAGREKLLAKITIYDTPTRGADLASKNSECI